MSRSVIVALLTLSLSVASSAQTGAIDSLRYVTEMPYICEYDEMSGCGDPLFWNVVKQKVVVVPMLIEKLADTTTTEAVVPNFGFNYTVADVAYTAIEEIISGIPTFELLPVEFDAEGCGYCSYWQHLNESIEYRRAFMKAVSHWYETNRSKLVWVASDQFLTCDCRGKHPNGGHFKLP